MVVDAGPARRKTRSLVIYPLITAEPTPPPQIDGVRVRLIGPFASVSRRETAAAVQRRGGAIDDEQPDWIVVGEDASREERDGAGVVAQATGVECLSESELWRRLGLVDDATGVRRLYSPAMLSELVGAPLAAIRRWTRRGSLRPVCRVNRLAYFDFEEARIAQLLAELLRQRGSLPAVDRAIDQLHLDHPAERPLAEASIRVVDGALRVRSSENLAEASGQRCFVFDPDEADSEGAAPAVLRMPAPEAAATPLRERAWGYSDAGEIDRAIEAWRLAMLESPPSADDQFTLAEWLYRDGQLPAARERYYAALELDGEHLEARVSLGCVLADLGDTDLAIAALQGALEQHAEFADAHYHVARLLRNGGQHAAAEPHWRRFLEIAPENPWAEEARVALADTLGEPRGE